LTRYNIVDPPIFTGFENYGAFVRDPLFWHSLRVTITMALALPLGLIAGFSLSLLLNQKFRRQRLAHDLLPALGDRGRGGRHRLVAHLQPASAFSTPF
jgi:ABC-type sugar transport system permease subunit